ncbi:hypothetical protein [Actinoplanes sp. NPDC048796]|uniref:hypothetical protein n=1 Tax=Actinoplanes sp. NPDC048796 TaxID=3155640 RepID=UPI0033D365E1
MAILGADDEHSGPTPSAGGGGNTPPPSSAGYPSADPDHPTDGLPPDFDAIYAYAAQFIELGDLVYEYAHNVLRTGLENVVWEGDQASAAHEALEALTPLTGLLASSSQDATVPSAARLLWNIGETINWFAINLEEMRAEEHKREVAGLIGLFLGLLFMGLMTALSILPATAVAMARLMSALGDIIASALESLWAGVRWLGTLGRAFGDAATGALFGLAPQLASTAISHAAVGLKIQFTERDIIFGAVTSAAGGVLFGNVVRRGAAAGAAQRAATKAVGDGLGIGNLPKAGPLGLPTAMRQTNVDGAGGIPTMRPNSFGGPDLLKLPATGDDAPVSMGANDARGVGGRVSVEGAAPDVPVSVGVNDARGVGGRVSVEGAAPDAPVPVGGSQDAVSPRPVEARASTAEGGPSTGLVGARPVEGVPAPSRAGDSPQVVSGDTGVVGGRVSGLDAPVPVNRAGDLAAPSRPVEVRASNGAPPAVAADAAPSARTVGGRPAEGTPPPARAVDSPQVLDGDAAGHGGKVSGPDAPVPVNGIQDPAPLSRPVEARASNGAPPAVAADAALSARADAALSARADAALSARADAALSARADAAPSARADAAPSARADAAPSAKAVGARPAEGTPTPARAVEPSPAGRDVAPTSGPKGTEKPSTSVFDRFLTPAERDATNAARQQRDARHADRAATIKDLRDGNSPLPPDEVARWQQGLKKYEGWKYHEKEFIAHYSRRLDDFRTDFRTPYVDMSAPSWTPDDVVLPGKQPSAGMSHGDETAAPKPSAEPIGATDHAPASESVVKSRPSAGDGPVGEFRPDSVKSSGDAGVVLSPKDRANGGRLPAEKWDEFWWRGQDQNNNSLVESPGHQRRVILDEAGIDYGWYDHDLNPPRKDSGPGSGEELSREEFTKWFRSDFADKSEWLSRYPGPKPSSAEAAPPARPADADAAPPRDWVWEARISARLARLGGGKPDEGIDGAGETPQAARSEGETIAAYTDDEAVAVYADKLGDRAMTLFETRRAALGGEGYPRAESINRAEAHARHDRISEQLELAELEHTLGRPHASLDERPGGANAEASGPSYVERVFVEFRHLREQMSAENRLASQVPAKSAPVRYNIKDSDRALVQVRNDAKKAGIGAEDIAMMETEFRMARAAGRPQDEARVIVAMRDEVDKARISQRLDQFRQQYDAGHQRAAELGMDRITWLRHAKAIEFAAASGRFDELHVNLTKFERQLGSKASSSLEIDALQARLDRLRLGHRPGKAADGAPTDGAPTDGASASRRAVARPVPADGPPVKAPERTADPRPTQKPLLDEKLILERLRALNTDDSALDAVPKRRLFELDRAANRIAAAKDPEEAHKLVAEYNKRLAELRLSGLEKQLRSGDSPLPAPQAEAWKARLEKVGIGRNGSRSELLAAYERDIQQYRTETQRAVSQSVFPPDRSTPLTRRMDAALNRLSPSIRAENAENNLGRVERLGERGTQRVRDESDGPEEGTPPADDSGARPPAGSTRELSYDDFPRVPAEAPREQAVPPKDEVTPSKGEVTPSKGEVTPSKGEVMPPKHEVAPPESVAVTSKGEIAMSEGTLAPSREGIAPPKDEVPPLKGETGVEGNAIVPPRAEEKPGWTDDSGHPRGGEAVTVGEPSQLQPDVQRISDLTADVLRERKPEATQPLLKDVFERRFPTGVRLNGAPAGAVGGRTGTDWLFADPKPTAAGWQSTASWEQVVTSVNDAGTSGLTLFLPQTGVDQATFVHNGRDGIARVVEADLTGSPRVTELVDYQQSHAAPEAVAVIDRCAEVHVPYDQEPRPS